MQIIAHRGHWTSQCEKNSKSAFERAFEYGFGIETDLRDHNGELVVCHDIPKGECMTCSEFFKLYMSAGHNETLALNIKADGLQGDLMKLIQDYDITNYYVFDMSIPDAISYIDQGMKVVCRHSDLEERIPFTEERAGVWCDSFDDTPARVDIALDEIQSGGVGLLVSPELHARPYRDAWVQWKQAHDALSKNQRNSLMICTDMPQEAQAFFGDEI